VSLKSDNEQKNHRYLTVIISIVLLVSTTFIGGEVLVRYLTRNNTDVLKVNGIAIPPLKPPIHQMQETIDDYKSRISESPFVYDEQLGWINQPLYELIDDGIFINAEGIRSSTNYDTEPSPNILRIALFGDSFTYSAGVPNDETLNYYMELSLAEMGIQAEVMNFGVPAYGPDQSYLRWLYEGINYQPDIVILSYSTRMSGRSLNIFRVISSPETRLPFSKPRFYLENDSLQLVNSPTIPLDEIIETFRDFETHPLRDYEYYYDDRYTETWWQQSRFLSYVSESIRNTYISYVGTTSTELIDVNSAIIQAFADNAHEHHTVFMLGHLPTQKNLSNDEGNFQYYDMLLKFRDQVPFLDATHVLSAIDQADGWLDDGHYAQAGNQIVGEYFANQIITCLDNTSCLPLRFHGGENFYTDSANS